MTGHLMEIVLFHFSFSDQLEEYLVPRWRGCLVNIVAENKNKILAFCESGHISVIEPYGPSNRAGSIWQGALWSSQEQDWRFVASSSNRLTWPQSIRTCSTRPPIPGDIFHKLPSRERISANIWSETEFHFNAFSPNCLSALPSQRGTPSEAASEGSCSWDSHCSTVVHIGWD